MRHIFIINPAAGIRDVSQELQEKILLASAKSGTPCDIFTTDTHGDIERYIRDTIAADSGQPMRFYICGGDGSLSEAATAAANNPNIAIGCIPAGSGNDFVKNFPDRDFHNIERQLAAPDRPIDLINVGDRYCINIASVGFDANVAYNMQKFKRIPFISGNAAYSLSLLYSLLSRINTEYTITVDGQEQAGGKYLLAAIANGISYGGHYKAAPYAKTDDGILDLCAIKKISRAFILKFIKIFEKGEHPERLKKYTDYRKCSTVGIRHKKKVRVNIDGEVYIMESPVFRIIPNGLRFILPTPSSSRPLRHANA
ncbi:MAG: YegS/Rv2252/BmrU family lipid kinase [Oscillospiraceae bacterium]|nr:YegS/Rv2252/BmrU family lipid kinase [Oscillospiraceae bacterium]